MGICVQPALCRHVFCEVMVKIFHKKLIIMHLFILQGPGQVIVSMDALFGLPRKKAAGKSIRSSVHGHYFFEDQELVDEYVESAPKIKTTSSKVDTCSYVNCC